MSAEETVTGTSTTLLVSLNSAILLSSSMWATSVTIPLSLLGIIAILAVTESASLILANTLVNTATLSLADNLRNSVK